jgi:hypothetical protein
MSIHEYMYAHCPMPSVNHTLFHHIPIKKHLSFERKESIIAVFYSKNVLKNKYIKTELL